MATTYLSPQQLKDFAQKVDEVAEKFPAEVVRIRHSFSRDWDGDPAIYFKILFTDEALRRRPLNELTNAVRNALIKDLALTHRSTRFTSHTSTSGLLANRSSSTIHNGDS